MTDETCKPPIDVDALTYKRLTGWKEIACPLSELPGGHHGHYLPDGPNGGRFICYRCIINVAGETLARICERIGKGHALLFPELVDLTPEKAGKAAAEVVGRSDDEDALGDLEDLGE